MWTPRSLNGSPSPNLLITYSSKHSFDMDQQSAFQGGWNHQMSQKNSTQYHNYHSRPNQPQQRLYQKNGMSPATRRYSSGISSNPQQTGNGFEVPQMMQNSKKGNNKVCSIWKRLIFDILGNVSFCHFPPTKQQSIHECSAISAQSAAVKDRRRRSIKNFFEFPRFPSIST